MDDVSRKAIDDDLERARAEIAQIDDQILALLAARRERVRRLHAWKRASGLPLIPLRCVARGDGYELRVEEPLELERSADRREAEEALLVRLNETYARWIRAQPEQWVWYRPRWSEPPHEAQKRLAARAPLSARTPRSH